MEDQPAMTSSTTDDGSPVIPGDPPPPTAPPPASTPPGAGLPLWVTVVVVLTLLALLAYNIVIIGPDGLPTSYVLGGLLGTYTGVQQLLKRRSDDGGPP